MSFKNTRRLTKSISPMGERSITPDGNSKCIYHNNMQILTMTPLESLTSTDLCLNSLHKALQGAHTIIVHAHPPETTNLLTVHYLKSTCN